MISWAEVVQLLSVMPYLRVIELGYNNLGQLGPARDQMFGTKLETLNLDENKLHSWTNVMSAIVPLKKLTILCNVVFLIEC